MSIFAVVAFTWVAFVCVAAGLIIAVNTISGYHDRRARRRVMATYYR